MKTVPAKTIVTRVKYGGSWFGCDYNMNIYRGCCHGCIYCDSRSDCYHIDCFDEVAAKENALEIIGHELSHKVLHGVVGTGAMSDPYNPFEEQEQLTRGALSLLNRNGFGLHLITKSDLVLRDLDQLTAIAEHSPVCVCLTITTFDDVLCKKIEPNAPQTSRRLAAIRQLSQAGIYTGVALMPILPYINDTWENISNIVSAAAQNGARFVYPFFGVTLRDSQRDYFYKRLDTLFPGARERYEKHFGTCYKCNSPNASRLYKKFGEQCGELGLLYKMNELTAAYKQGRTCEQLRLF